MLDVKAIFHKLSHIIERVKPRFPVLKARFCVCFESLLIMDLADTRAQCAFLSFFKMTGIQKQLNLGGHMGV